MLCEDNALALSLAISKSLAENRPNQELAVLASFFTSLAANLSLIIQNRNLCGQSPCPSQSSDIAGATGTVNNLVDLEELA